MSIENTGTLIVSQMEKEFYVFETDAPRESGHNYGIAQGGGIVYEADFKRETAKRLCDLCNSNPSMEWDEAERILIFERLDVSCP